MNTRRSYLSLETPPTYYILAAVAVRPLTAYGIVQQTKVDSDSAVAMSPGSMTHALRRLVARCLIEPLEGEARPRYYLTAGGRRVLEVEQKHHEHAAFIGHWALAGRSVANTAAFSTLEI